jgi:hypothetical protein
MARIKKYHGGRLTQIHGVAVSKEKLPETMSLRLPAPSSAGWINAKKPNPDTL